MQERIVETKREERGTGIILHAKAQKNENRTAQRTKIYIYYHYFHGYATSEIKMLFAIDFHQSKR